MNLKSWLAVLVVVASGMAGCGNEEMSLELDPAQAADTGRVPFDDDDEHGEKQSALAGDYDHFNCFKAGTCPAPSLTGSTRCLRGRDWEVSSKERRSDVIVFSFHGGEVESSTSEVSGLIADHFGWSRYDFEGHGTSTCLGGERDSVRLHITATKFNDPVALDLAARHRKGVAIHGYSSSRGNERGVICVGGSNSGQIKRFISAVSSNRSRFKGYWLEGVNAAAGDSWKGANCSGLGGTARSNLVNRVGDGGLQLEMSEGLKSDLADPASRYNPLRDVLFRALEAALD
jgi:phage replication-related protein YjqB (UPF0714/DUF867 family)